MRRLLLIVCLTGLALIASAQKRLEYPELWLGAKAGAGISINKEHPIEPTGGFVFRYSRQKYCALQLEAAWEQGYIEVPILMHLYFGPSTGKFFINLGPELAVNPQGAFDMGLTGGLGGQIRTKKAGAFEIEARYLYSITKRPMDAILTVGWMWPIRQKRQVLSTTLEEKLTTKK